MRRRTAWWRRRARGGRQPATVTPAATVARRVAVVGAVLGALAALPGQTALATAAGTPSPYAYAPGAERVDGATSAAKAQQLKPGSTYRGSLPKGAKFFYRLHLDATTNGYVSVTAVPEAGGTVAATDGIRVSMQDASGSACTYQSATFGAVQSPRPLAAGGFRQVGGSLCQGAGWFRVLVERIDATGSSPHPWGLELTAVTEPGLTAAGPTDAPQQWDSASPEPLTGETRRRAGGPGFAGATAVGQGVWRTDVRPGRTLFYEVPVDWGQQLSATAELGASSSGGSGYVSALDLSLYNPVRGYVEEAALGYSGTRSSVGLEPLPPVGYRNRYSALDRVSGMRFAGSYYLVVHLAAQVADTFGQGPLPLTLRVRVRGAAQTAPAYAGQSDPHGVFKVTAGDRRTAATGPAGSGGTAMKVVAVSGIGTGSALLATLGLWTVLARRRAGAAR
ncbi:hypothetical protein [Streptomyces sp. NPDC005423]|uniref:hypothetical protein n=1 Tax=Streptomyces sp. NPDC005423 TaxID=3155343 RepID=UPI00339F756D